MRTIYKINLFTIRVGLLLTILTAALLAVAAPNFTSAAPATFSVTNTNDSGPGSLRQAIIDANENNNPGDTDTIEFNIPGSDVHTITLSSQLPDISEKVFFDGYTSQEGAQKNTSVSPEPFNSIIKIELNGNQEIDSGLIFNSGSSGSIISGLSIYDFKENAVVVRSNDVSFLGNYLGLKADGMTKGEILTPHAIILQNWDGGGNDIKIGGTNPADRNIFLGSSGGSGAITMNGEDGEVYGNYIGIAKDGETELSGCVLGISSENTTVIGGPSAGQPNLISGCSAANVILTGAGSVVQGNYVGTDYRGNASPNITNGVGIVLSGAAEGNLVGGTNPGEGNIVKGASGMGIGVQRMKISAYGVDLSPAKNSFLGNSIGSVNVFDYPNFGQSNQGIDLYISEDNSDPADFIMDKFEHQGPSLNDEGDADEGPNGLINFPVLKSAQQIGDQLTIEYDLDAADSPTNSYRIELFTNDERSIFGYGPGEVFVGALESVNPGNGKTATITVSGNLQGKAISATTTAIDASTGHGFGATSEFSQNISVGSQNDFDADGIPDSEEDAGPNAGDANGDGIQDSQQPTVTTFVNSANIYNTLITEGCSENSSVSSLNIKSLNRKDNGYDYPYGLTDFTLYCSRGGTVKVELFIHANIQPDGFMPRKFNPNDERFGEVMGASLDTVNIGNSKALKLTYSITDGGQHDDDGIANGIIADPVGLAVEGQTTADELVKTGVSLAITTFIASTIIASVIYTYYDYRNHKRPLVESDKEMHANNAKAYTYWHHLKVVSFPLAKYRVKVVLERKVPLPVKSNS